MIRPVVQAKAFVRTGPAVRLRVVRAPRIVVDASRMMLVPVGDGDSEHLGGGISQAAKVQLVNGLFEVGRQEPADIIIPVPSVSGRHAMIRVEEERVTVTDLRSTNGTYLDGTEITAMEAYEVLPGNTIIFGDEHLAMYELVTELVEEPVTAPAPTPAPASDA